MIIVSDYLVVLKPMGQTVKLAFEEKISFHKIYKNILRKITEFVWKKSEILKKKFHLVSYGRNILVRSI